ncbi:MAG: PEP/pyruvate-binding domain-containing protein [Candidatus Hermodarchaeota archaeon]
MIKKNSLIVNLRVIKQKTKEVGTKAANLGELIQNKFYVPDGFVITTRAYELFLKNNNLMGVIENLLENLEYNNLESLNQSVDKIQNMIMKSELPRELTDEIKTRHQQFSSYGIAIRSSATAEDLPNASFAGQYDTYLNVREIDQILYYIKRCYASLWSNRAIIYRYKNKIPHNLIKMAVIIQKMVDAKSAGVLFTINPITSNNDELLIESNFGLGESIVSGKINPDQFIIKKIKRGLLKIISRLIGKKTIAVFPKNIKDEGGITYNELNDDLINQTSLSDGEILQIAKIGLQIVKSFHGIPQDIEWAFDQKNTINILQTRPITAIKADLKTPKILWTRGYSDDYWNDNVSPLFFELLGDQITKVVNIELNDIMGYKRMDTQLLKLYNAHVYFNLNVIKRKIENEIPKFMRNEDILNYFPEGSGPYGKKTMKELPFHLIKRIVAELRIMLHDPNGSMSKTAEAYDNWNQIQFEPYCKLFDKKLEVIKKTNNLADLLDLAKDLDKIMIDHFRLIRYGIPVHNIGMNLLIQYLLTRFLGKEACSRFYPILVSGLNHKLTETNDQIHYLASLINKSSYLKNLISNNKSENVYKKLLEEKEPSINKFLKVFEHFLEIHGDRGFTREIYYPRWREPPMINLFDIFKSLITDQWQELDIKKAKNLHKRELIEKIVESKIRSQRFGLLKWKFLYIILKNSRKYIIFRENQRFNLDKWITRNRNVYLEIGIIFKKRGLIPDENLIFFFGKEEIEKLALKEYNKEKIEEMSIELEKRYKLFLQHVNKLPPKFLLGSREFNDVLKNKKENKIFRGIPASQGIITAPIRVLENIDLISTVRSGEILVVSRTDPGWTPVFSKIAGLITETGGILSHGAVISREYSIPAVTNIVNACHIFKTGQIIKIDGFNGIVTIQEKVKVNKNWNR